MSTKLTPASFETLYQQYIDDVHRLPESRVSITHSYMLAAFELGKLQQSRRQQPERRSPVRRGGR